MKVLILFFLCFLCVFATLDEQLLKKSIADCSKQIPDSEKEEDLKLCLYKKMGLMNKTGDFQKDVFKKMYTGVLSASKIEEILTRCLVKKSTPQDSAASSYDCLEESTEGLFE